MESQEKYTTPFAQNLRELLEKRRGNITALARELGISRQSVAQYMDGTGQPNAEKLCLIADYFDVSVDWLLGRSGGIKALDPDVMSVAKYIGLSESAIDFLHSLKNENSDFLRVINSFLDDETFRAILPEIINLEHVKMEVDLESFGMRQIEEGWTGNGYIVNGYDYFDMLEFRIAQHLNLVVSAITEPSLKSDKEIGF